MRFSIRRKLLLVVGILFCLFVFSAIFLQLGARFIYDQFTYVVEIEEPKNDAAYEMEINLYQMATALRSYLRDRDTSFIEEMGDAEKEFDRYQTRYVELADSDDRRQMGDNIEKAFAAYKVKAEQILQNADARHAKWNTLTRNFSEMEYILDKKIQARLRLDEPVSRRKLEAALELEIKINEMSRGFEAFLETDDISYEKQIQKDEAEFKQIFESYAGMALSEEETRWSAELKTLFDQTGGIVYEIIGLAKARIILMADVVRIRREIDSRLDNQIQVKSRSDVVAAEQVVRQTLGRTNRWLLMFILGGIVAGVLSVYFIARSVVRPIEQLVSATDRVTAGDIAPRVDIRSGDEFEDLAAHFNQMVEERARIDRMKTDFMFMVTHELNSPIGVASGAAELLRGTLGAPNEKQARYLDMIHRNMERLQRLSTDLVDLMKLDAGQFSIRKRPNNIHKTIHDACEALAPAAKEREVALEFPSTSESPAIVLNIDSDRIEQVITNLVRNAIRFAKSKVEVRVEAGASECLISVEDDGPGVDENDLPKLFEKFYQGKQMPGQKKIGSGLGLAIVKGIVEAHGGTVRAANRDGALGAKFVVRFPSETAQ